MAVVRKLEKVTLEKDNPHREAECTYSFVDGKQGRCLQVDTYGSKTRKCPGKKSQSIRFAPEAIKQLKHCSNRTSDTFFPVEAGEQPSRVFRFSRKTGQFRLWPFPRISFDHSDQQRNSR